MNQLLRQPLEQRASPRRVVHIAAVIAFAGGRRRIACVIRNMSPGGAKLEVASVREIPQTFDMLVPGRDPLACQVVWRSLKELGVAFA